MARIPNPAEGFRDRYPASDVHPSATFPRSLRAASPGEAARGIAVAYATSNWTVYRAVVDRLQPNEAFRMETQFGAYEMTRSQLEAAFPTIVASRSYQTGSDSMPNKCYYVQGPPPVGADQFRVR